MPPHAAEASRPVSAARRPRGRGHVHTQRPSITLLLEAHLGTGTVLLEWHQVHFQGPGRPLPLLKEHPGVRGHGNQEAVWSSGENMGLPVRAACGPPPRYSPSPMMSMGGLVAPSSFPEVVWLAFCKSTVNKDQNYNLERGKKTLFIYRTLRWNGLNFILL